MADSIQQGQTADGIERKAGTKFDRSAGQIRTVTEVERWLSVVEELEAVVSAIRLR